MKKLISLLLIATGLFKSLSAQSCVFKVTSGEHTLYLGGTFHLLRAEDFPLPPEFEKAYAASQALYFETDIGGLTSPEGQKLMQAHMLYPEGKTLKQVLSKEAWQALRQSCIKAGLPLDGSARLKPWVATMTLAVLELKKFGLVEEGVDIKFYKQAKTDGKTVKWFETIEEQMAFLEGKPGNESEEVLSGLEMMKTDVREMLPLVAAWKKGNLEKIDGVIGDLLRKQSPEMYRRIIVDRNNNWMPVVNELLKTPEVEFVLVGAGHLSGPEGLVAQLKASGCSVEQIVAGGTEMGN